MISLITPILALYPSGANPKKQPVLSPLEIAVGHCEPQQLMAGTRNHTLPARKLEQIH